VTRRGGSSRKRSRSQIQRKSESKIKRIHSGRGGRKDKPLKRRPKPENGLTESEWKKKHSAEGGGQGGSNFWRTNERAGKGQPRERQQGRRKFQVMGAMKEGGSEKKGYFGVAGKGIKNWQLIRGQSGETPTRRPERGGGHRGEQKEPLTLGK